MVCKDLRDEIFEAALSGAAPADDVKAHISTCATCENEYESLRSTMNVLDTWTTPEPSPYFDVRLRARLREVKEQEAATAGGRLARWFGKLGIRHASLSWKPAAAVAFAVMLAIGGGVYRFGIGIDRTSGPVAVSQPCPV